MINKIMNLLGYRELSNIKISKEFEIHPPKKEKMWERETYYECTGKFLVPIVLKDNLLIDGYTTYLLAKRYHKKYVKVEEV